MTKAHKKKLNRTETSAPFGKPMGPQKIKNAALERGIQLF
jgi:hypothetical protein